MFQYLQMQSRIVTLPNIVEYHSLRYLIFFGYFARRNPRITLDAPDDAAATSDTTTAQNQVDLVKSMSPEERKEYVTNFLRTQVFNNMSSLCCCISILVYTY